MNRGHKPTLLDYGLLATVSAAVLCYEIILLRVFTQSQWHHFASLAVSLALLGFGAAGTALSLLGERVHRDPEKWIRLGLLIGIVGMLVCWILLLKVQVRPLFAAWDPRELAKLLLLDFSAFIPFFGLALCIGLALVRWPSHVRSLYGTNLLGSGLGAIMASLLLATAFLNAILPLIPLLLCVVSGIYLWIRSSTKIWSLACLATAALLLVGPALKPPGIPVSDFKRLSYLKDLPDSRVLERHPGLRDELTILRSDSLRLTTGLSLRWAKPVPATDALVLGTGRVLPLPREDRGPAAREHLSARLSALPLKLRPEGTLLLLGTSEWMTPYHIGPRNVLWSEPDPRIRVRFEERFNSPQLAGMELDPRPALLQPGPPCRLILMSLAYEEGDAVSEDYLLTREAIATALKRLEPQGLLALPVRLNYPPRYEIRLMRMVAGAMEQLDVENPARHVAFIRSLQEGLLLVSRDPLGASDIAEIRAFAGEWDFDLSLLPDLKEEEANRFNQLPEAVYHQAGKLIFTGQGDLPAAASWYLTEPATDTRPYFWRSMTLGSIPALLQAFGRQGIIWLDWSLVITVAKLAVASLLAALLILLPLRRLPATGRGGRLRTFLYFGSLGLGFMLVEMVVYQRCILYLADPVVTASIVFTIFLVGAGLGSMTPPRGRGPRGHAIVFLLILILVLASFALLRGGQDFLLRQSLWLRGLLLALLLAPLAWSMGKAFPWGLSRVNETTPGLVPWAWAINGFFSVMAAPTAMLLSVQFGQSLTWTVGAACYGTAWLAARGWRMR